MHPNAVKILNLYQSPNFAGPGAIIYISAAPSQQLWREDMIRIDHQFSPNWKMYGRYAHDSPDIPTPYGETPVSSISNRFPAIPATTATRPGQNLAVNLTTTTSRSLLNEFNFTYAGREITQQAIADLSNRTKLGVDIPKIFQENIGNLIPTAAISGIATLNVARAYLKQLFNLELSDNVTKVKGKHIFKMGGIYSYGGNRENPSSSYTNGSFSFTTGFSKNPLANVLLGLPATYTETEHLVVSHARFASLEAFVQADWKSARRLMLHIGVRYTNFFNPWDTENVLTNFLPSAFTPAPSPTTDPTPPHPL